MNMISLISLSLSLTSAVDISDSSYLALLILLNRAHVAQSGFSCSFQIISAPL